MMKNKAIPMMASIATMIAKIITAIMLMARALSQPQSKKCLTNNSQSTSSMMRATQPEKK